MMPPGPAAISSHAPPTGSRTHHPGKTSRLVATSTPMAMAKSPATPITLLRAALVPAMTDGMAIASSAPHDSSQMRNSGK